MVRGKSGCSMFKGLPSSRILKQISRLNLIAGTPETAFKFDPKITKLEVYLIKDNVMGAAIGLKKFWRKNLPTLKFHNEDAKFVFKRIKTTTKEDLAKCPTKIIIHDSDNNQHEIDCANQDNGSIMEKVIRATNAKPVPALEIPTIPFPSQTLY